jgi:hypothetical protein
MKLKKSIIVLCSLIMFSNQTFTQEKDLAATIGRAERGKGKWGPGCWIGTKVGSGFDPSVKDPTDPNTQVYKLVGGGDVNKAWSNRVVFCLTSPPFQLTPGYEYTFKGRLKTSDVGQKVNLLAAIRKGGLKDLNSASISETKDWTELVVGPFKVNAKCQAKYLAVNMMGPGTVWVGKLSLLEKKISPLNIKLPIAEYSADDKTAVVDINLSVTDLNGLSIQMQIKNSAGKIKNKKVTPTKSKFKASIPIAKLKPGKYQLTVKLLKNETELGSKTVSFTKTSESMF